MEIIEQDHKKYTREWSSADEFMTQPPDGYEKLCDIDVGRLKDMDEAGIDMQVLSFPLGLEGLEVSVGTRLASEVNDEISVAVKKYPDRFAGFASLALKAPSAAGDELERAVKQLGFKGTMVLPHVGGEFIDAKKYWPTFERAAKLGVPVYIHPIHPPKDRLKQYAGYPKLAGSMWGFAIEAGTAAMRLICSGIFDEYPDLKIILGHLGEALPFWMSRLDDRIQTTTDTAIPPDFEVASKADAILLTKKLKKLPSQYIRDNFFVTTSGILWQPALQCTLMALGADKILFATDYPFEPGREAVEFMETVPISDSNRENILHLNAERLLGL